MNKMLPQQSPYNDNRIIYRIKTTSLWMLTFHFTNLIQLFINNWNHFFNHFTIFLNIEAMFFFLKVNKINIHSDVKLCMFYTTILPFLGVKGAIAAHESSIEYVADAHTHCFIHEPTQRPLSAIDLWQWNSIFFLESPDSSFCVVRNLLMFYKNEITLIQK